jgi:hypothetical protein
MNNLVLGRGKGLEIGILLWKKREPLMSDSLVVTEGIKGNEG